MQMTSGVKVLPMKRPNFFVAAPATAEQREELAQMRKDYRELDKAVAEMRSKIARIQGLDETSQDAAEGPGQVRVAETHFIGYHTLRVNSSLDFDPVTGQATSFSQVHEGSGDTFRYSNRQGVERFEQSPTNAGVTYTLDHNQSTMTIARPSLEKSDVAHFSGGGGGAWIGVFGQPRHNRHCEIAEIALESAAGTLAGAGLGLTLGLGIAALV